MEIVGMVRVETQSLIGFYLPFVQPDDIGLQTLKRKNEVAGRFVVKLRQCADDACVGADALCARIAVCYPKFTAKSELLPVAFKNSAEFSLRRVGHRFVTHFA